METDVPALLQKMMDILPANQAGLAKRLGGGIGQPHISRWLKGVAPDLQNYNRITALADSLGLLTDVRSEDVASNLSTAPQPPKVKLKGYVGAGAEAHFYALADEDFEEVDAPAGATDQTVAVEIRGTSLGKLLNKWLVFYNDVRSPVTPDLIGELCVVGLADDRILVKKIVQNRRGGFNLLSNTDDPPIENAQIEWAALVTDLRRRR